ncbi:MAG: nucleotidyltransferase family protein [Methyloceanibacter sp.]
MKITAIVLAAGRSSRMAPRNKLLERVDGEAIVALVARTAIASGAKPVVVVTGFEAERVVAALRGLNLTIVHNEAFAEGLSTSLKTCLKALPPNCDGALILLGDMPKIDSSALDALVAAFATRDSICVPVHEGQRGNPILWGASYFPEMLAITGDVGAKRLIARHADRVIEVPVASPGIFADVDIPSDLARLKQTIG